MKFAPTSTQRGNSRSGFFGKPVECQISYNPETERYRFHSEDLNNLFRARETGDRAYAQTANQRIAAEQSFRILVRASFRTQRDGALNRSVNMSVNLMPSGV